MSQSPVSEVPVSDGYDRSIWESPDKPHPTRADSLGFEDERLSNDNEEARRIALLKTFRILAELELS